MRFPVDYIAITNSYKKGVHDGVDFGWNNSYGGKNVPIYSVDDGRVISIQKQKTGGNVINILHNNGFISIYGHLKSINVVLNQKVLKAEQIGIMGNTGSVYDKNKNKYVPIANHLHFALYKGDKVGTNINNFVDPLQYLYRTTNQIVGASTDSKYNILENRNDKEEEVAYQIKVVKSKGGLNVRNKPINGKILKLLKDNEEVMVYAERDGWSKISLMNEEWVSSKYLAFKNNLVMAYPIKTVTSKGGLNVRTKPVNGKVIKTLKYNDKVTVYKESSGWSKISLAKEEWVSSNFLK